MKSVTVTAPQFDSPRHQMSDDTSVDAVDTAVVGYSLADPRGADDGKSLSKEAISTALARGTTGCDASVGAPAGSTALDSSVLSTIAESTTLTMNPDNSNSHETSVAGANGRTDMRRGTASGGFDGPIGHGTGTVNSSVGSSIYEPGSAVPSDALETPAFAAEVAMMCSRVIRTALYRAGMAPSSATWRVVRFIQNNGPVRISDVARRERSTMATVSTLVNRLVKQGLVNKEKDTADARQSLLTVTPKGRNLCNEWQDRLGEAVAEDFASLSLDELTVLAEALPVMRKLVSEGER
ncbi:MULTISPECIES: MarR family winged helix-turn-helix transcriptional regulator [Corynebacterium]|uniref:MarR family winged helix-turn-helix transcriptional regulator n=1 Tax=Corynebacterium TaxID=1716 RepID=UPI00195D2A52|nr:MULTISPECIES: MarR family transcriptional regulator [Corynebacterium]MDN8625164.1 MarR family transcriptional regulator [Corynebacterium kroppenstedtii]QRQ64911.1 MarR family transcriptional regulator [Corynebacterium kroppenstedtii]